MLTLRYILRLVTAFFVRFRGILLIGVLLGIIFFFLSRILSPFFIGRSTEKIGVTGRYHAEELPNSILKNIGEGLTKIAEDGTVEPALASSWETPDKGKTWTFHLKGNITWQDDKNVESADIVYEFSDVEIERPNNKTIVFKLKEPFSPFPSVVSRPTFRKGLLGTGKWKVKKVSLAGSFIQELVLVNELKKKIIYKFYPTEEQTKLAYKLGEIDIIDSMFNPSPFDSWNTVATEKKVDTSQVVTIFFNNQDKLLSDKSLRQALIYAINKKDFDGLRAISPITSISWASNPRVKQYNYDPDRAREFIDELADEFKENLEIKLVSTPQLLPAAESIADQWEKIGVETLVQVTSVVPSDFQVFLAIFEISPDPDQYSMWHSTQKETNVSRYSNPRIDKLLEDGRIELNLEERRKIYLDFQRFLVEDSPAAFLYNPSLYRITRK